MRSFPVFFIIFLFWACYAHAQKSQSVIADSLVQLPNVDSLVQVSGVDSLIDLKPIDSLNRKINATEEKFSALKDSLNAITQFPDSLLSNEPLIPVMQQIDSAQLKIHAFADSLQRKARLPDSLKKFLPKEAALLENQELPEIGTKELDKVKALNEVKEKIKDLEELKEVTDLGEVKPLQEVGELKELDKLSEQKKALKEISGKAENLSKTAESEIKKTKGFQELEAQKEKLGKQKAVLEKFKDEHYYKEKAVSTVKEKAKDHFAGHMDKLRAAQEKLAKIKKKYPGGVSSIKDLPKIPPNAMKGKPFKERLLLGLTLQVHPAQTPNIDLSPFAAYKLTGRLLIGLGGNYRLMTKDNFKGFTREGAVYGYRGFAELKIHKGIFVHAGYELMKSQRRDSLLYKARGELEEKIWVDGLMVGLGKDYSIARFIKGNMQVLYNVLDEVNSPYRNKVMVRFGFSFQFNKKIKKPEIPKINKKEVLKESKKKAEKETRKFMKEKLK